VSAVLLRLAFSQKVKHACRVKRADRWNNFLVEVNQELTVRETAELLK
jgi:hypothetical protein